MCARMRRYVFVGMYEHAGGYVCTCVYETYAPAITVVLVALLKTHYALSVLFLGILPFPGKGAVHKVCHA